MDLSAVAGSPALLVLQTLAASDTASTASTSTPAQSAVTTSNTGESLSVTAGASLYVVSQGIGQALSATDAAAGAGQTILGLLAQMRQAAGQAGGTALTTAGRQALDQSFQASASAIAPAVQSATVGGVNLLDGSLTGGLKTSLGDGATASLTGLDLTRGGSTLAAAGASLSTPEAAQSAQAVVEAAIPAATTALDGLQTQADGLATHAALVQSLGQAVAAPSIDDGGDGARLLALQVGQLLSAQSGTAIANAAPQQVLALFRR